jgi:hypothetical protein
MTAHPITPDGRYFVVRGRLWRMANPSLPSAEKQVLVKQLMAARRAVRTARLAPDEKAEGEAHAAVDVAKRALGERGPVWWTDGAADLNRRMARTTPYAAWFATLEAASKA